MKQEGLVSNYATVQFKPQKDTYNKSMTENILNRQFHDREYRDVVISNLTYVRVGAHWNYICVLVDLHNREIIGCSAGEHKTAGLVTEAFQSVEGNLEEIRLFHTDHGNDSKNRQYTNYRKRFIWSDP